MPNILLDTEYVDKLKKDNARLKEENRAGTNALKLSGQALSKALDDVEKLLAENKLLKERLDEITDRLKNGITYDGENNQYILVWTEREIKLAKEEADELYKFFKEKRYEKDS